MRKIPKQHFLLAVITAVLIIGGLSVMVAAATAANCWEATSQSACESNPQCTWEQDSWGEWCSEKGCWNYYTQSECPSFVPGTTKNCTWRTGGTWGWCEQTSCYSFEGTNQSVCENNSLGLNCRWEGMCRNVGGNTFANCWNYTTQSDCNAASGCSWGSCMETGCWNYNDATSCAAGQGSSGNSCAWNSQYNYCYEQGCWDYNETACNAASDCVWQNGYCSEPQCYHLDFTNASACVNNTYNISCEWSDPYCNTKGCWNYDDESSCNAQQPECNWRTSTSTGWCEEVQCWTWDSWNGGNQSICENNSYGLNCVWQNMTGGSAGEGWCYQNISALSCSNFTSERDCMDTYYCWWEYTDWNDPSQGGTCKDPTQGADTIFQEWNPGCYIFDTNQTVCESMLGCSWTGSGCVGNATIQENGLSCANVNDSSICNNIAVLSKCCSWQGGSCVENTYSTSCWDNMEQPPEGAHFCEDYNSYTTEDLCNQIANWPWFMPCTWDNTTSTCKFKSSSVFGNQSNSLVLIDNKKTCEAAGGKWITENYCEGNTSVPGGRCEYKFDEETNCNKACFACENQSDGSAWNSTEAARQACKGSALGICDFDEDSSAPNGYGYCRVKDAFSGGMEDCDSDCGACTYMGDPTSASSNKRPKYFCENSNAECKWVVDNSTVIGGYCIGKSEKTCTEACDRCKTQSDCVDKGRTSYGSNGACEWDASKEECNRKGQASETCWDAIDNDDDGLIDCADPQCFSDPFCGFSTGDCFGWSTNESCVNNNCEWVTDNWGSWCDYPGSQCWKFDGNQSACTNASISGGNCQWFNESGSGWCEEDWSAAEACMGLNMTSCASPCVWTNDTWCSGAGAGTDWCNDYGGWCDHEDFQPKQCWLYDGNETACTNNNCSWSTSDWPYCSVDYSANCWQYNDNSSCTDAGCYWSPDNWCGTPADQCGWLTSESTCSANSNCRWNEQWDHCESKCFMQNHTESSCNSISSCRWVGGWCNEQSNSCWNITNSTTCNANSKCKWKNPGKCDPSGFAGGAGGGYGGGGESGMQCYKYDGNETLCLNVTGCGWFPEPSPFCGADYSKDCWQYYDNSSCTSAGCFWKNDSFGSWCMSPADQCWSYQDPSSCTASGYCNWRNDTGYAWCESKCFNLSLSSNECNSLSGCKWTSGWCNPQSMNMMFIGMEPGAPIELGGDACPETGMEGWVDICGFGMKDMGESYGFGVNIVSLNDTAACRNKKLMDGTFGTGNRSFKLYIYLDTDGSMSGSCALSHDTSTEGYEFRFRYESLWNSSSSKTVESLNAFKCSKGKWEAANIKLDTWAEKMCSEIGGPMIAVDKTGLSQYPALYDPSQDMRVYVAMANATGNASLPRDTGGPSWVSTGAIDFEISDAFQYGADITQYESILQKGYVQFEDCFNNVDDDNDNATDCYDYDCQFASICEGQGVNDPSYIDTTSPKVIGVKKEEYPDAALIMYDTNKPTNGTVVFYGVDSRCSGNMTEVHDIGVSHPSVREYKSWHYGKLNNETLAGGQNNITYLQNATVYYYKLKVCDSGDKCAVSKCSNFTTASSVQKCGYCKFVTRIKTPSDWVVSYDTDRDGTYDHIQGQVCGPKAGMKTNYTHSLVNIMLNKSDGSTYLEFLNVTLTKTGLNDKVRTISSSNSLLAGTTTTSSGTVGYSGLASETRDKIINNLHPEVCRIKIQGTLNELWHCDDNLTNCVNMTENATLVDSSNTSTGYRVWEIPYCEFSVWAGGEPTTSSSSSSSGGGGGGGGAAIAGNQTAEDTEDASEAPSEPLKVAEKEEGVTEEKQKPAPGGEEKEGVEETSEGTNTYLAVGIGVTALIVVAGVLYAFSRRKSRHGKK